MQLCTCIRQIGCQTQCSGNKGFSLMCSGEKRETCKYLPNWNEIFGPGLQGRTSLSPSIAALCWPRGLPSSQVLRNLLVRAKIHGCIETANPASYFQSLRILLL